MNFIKKKSKNVKRNLSKARLHSFFSPLSSTFGLAMILLQGWNHFWNATTMNRSTREEATMASGKTQEMKASLSTAKISSEKILLPVSGWFSTSCLLLAFFAAKKGRIGEILFFKF